jgi:hypothetical protein
MADYSKLVKTAIKDAQQKATEERRKATISEVYEGQIVETEYINRDGAIWQQIRVEGKITSENRVYKVNSDKPYTRGFGRYWYLDNEAKTAMQTVL